MTTETVSAVTGYEHEQLTLVEGARGRLQTAQLRSSSQASTVHDSQRRLVALVAAVDGPLELLGATRQKQLVLIPASEGVAMSVWPVDCDGDRCHVEPFASGAGVVVDAIAMPAGHESDWQRAPSPSWTGTVLIAT